MALLVAHLPIIHHQATNCTPISARDMGTLIYNFWQTEIKNIDLWVLDEGYAGSCFIFIF